MTTRRAGLIAIVAIAIGAAACGHGAATPPAARAPAGKPGQGQRTEIVLSEEIANAGPVAAAWMVYGLAKTNKLHEVALPPANDSGDDFLLELEARKAQSELWAESERSSDPALNAQLDQQVEVWRAGFLPELVVVIHGRPGWTVPAAQVASLRLEEFSEKFRGRSFASGARAAIRPASGKLYPDVPGGDFPDPASLPVGPATCGVARAQRAAAWKRWDALVPRLGGAPIAASSTLDFARQLIALKRDRERAPRDVTWVSARVAHLAMVEGFCAVEEKDWPRALTTLARAIALAPSASGPRFELSGALTMVGRNKEALKEADRVLVSAPADDGCTIARAWRRRGYILVEMNALAQAREAYVKSLAIDPGNRIALSELATIDAALKQGKGVKESPELTVPPGTNVVVVTSCKPAASK